MMNRFFTLLTLMFFATAVSAQVYTKKANMSIARYCAGTAVVNGKLYAIGGADASTVKTLVEEYDPANNTWTTKASLPQPRTQFGIAAVNGKIYVIGGWSGTAATNTVFEYDPANNSWATKAAMPTTRSEVSAAAVGGKIYVTWGSNSTIKAMEEYNPATNTWASKTDCPVGMWQWNGGAGLGTNFYAMGGVNSTNAHSAAAYRYNTTNNSWSTIASMPGARFYGAAFTFDNKVHYFGGGDGTVPTLYKNPTNTLYIYDHGSDSWSTGPACPVRRSVVSVATIGNKFYIVGGLDSNDQVTNSLWEFSPPCPAPSSVTVVNPPIGGNPSCLNSTITLTTTTAGGPVVTNYAWFKRSVGGVIIPGPSCATCSTWTSNGFANLDTAWVVMSYQNTCGSFDTMSNKLLLIRPISVPPSVTIGLVYGTFPSCVDDSLSIGVTTNVNPGGAPQYQWRVNGINNGPLTTSPTFNATGLPDGTVVSVVMNSSAGLPCASPSSATSNNVVIDTAIKTPTVSVSLISGTNPGCAGQLLSFRAFPQVGGTNPGFQWYKNGVLVPGVTGDTYTSVFNNADQVYVRVTSNSPCSFPAPNNTATSTPVTVTHIMLTADITISQVVGTNPACSKKVVAFAANATSAGINPSFQWLINGLVINGANGVTYLTDSLKDNDIVRCVLLSTDPCVSNPVDTSNEIIMTVIPSLTPAINISITRGKNPGCLDSLVEFTAIATDIGNSPLYSWKINSFDVSFGSAVYTSSAFLNGDVVIACASQTDGGCYIPDTVCSAPFNMVRSTTPDPPLIHLIGNKLVTNIQPGSYIWFGPDGRENVGGYDGNFLPAIPGDYFAVTNNNGCWSKPSNILKIILLDINTIDLEGLKVYPNPTTGKLILDWDKTQVNMNVDVYNPLGQMMIHEKMIDQSRKELDLSSLTNGIYHVVVRDQHGKTGTIKISLTK